MRLKVAYINASFPTTVLTVSGLRVKARICLLSAENYRLPEDGFAMRFNKIIHDTQKKVKCINNYYCQRLFLRFYSLEEGSLELSNNRAERSMKPFVIDRKNFLFANTPKGATGSAVMFSLIQTAIENNLDPYKYLAWLLRAAKDADLTNEQTIQALLPWNAAAECGSK